MSKAKFIVGNITQVSWPPIDRPSIATPSTVSPLLLLGASCSEDDDDEPEALLLIPAIDGLQRESERASVEEAEL